MERHPGTGSLATGVCDGESQTPRDEGAFASANAQNASEGHVVKGRSCRGAGRGDFLLRLLLPTCASATASASVRARCPLDCGPALTHAQALTFGGRGRGDPNASKRHAETYGVHEGVIVGESLCELILQLKRHEPHCHGERDGGADGKVFVVFETSNRVGGAGCEQF